MSHNHEIPAIFAELRDSNTATGRALRALAEPSPEQKHMKRHNCLTRTYLPCPVGVRAQGSSMGDVNFNFAINNEGAATQTSVGDPSAAWQQFATRIKGMILDEMTTQKRPGGLLYGT